MNRIGDITVGVSNAISVLTSTPVGVVVTAITAAALTGATVVYVFDYLTSTTRGIHEKNTPVLHTSVVMEE